MELQRRRMIQALAAAAGSLGTLGRMASAATEPPPEKLHAAGLAVLLFEIVASREASAFILGLERGVEEQEADEGALEPVPGPG